MGIYLQHLEVARALLEAGEEWRRDDGLRRTVHTYDETGTSYRKTMMKSRLRLDRTGIMKMHQRSDGADSARYLSLSLSRKRLSFSHLRQKCKREKESSSSSRVTAFFPVDFHQANGNMSNCTASPVWQFFEVVIDG